MINLLYKKNKIIIVLFIGFLFILTNISSNIQGIVITKKNDLKDSMNFFQTLGKKGELIITLESKPYQIINTNEGKIEIIMEEFSSTLIPGYPKLPSKIFLIGIPPGAEIISIELIKDKNEIVPVKNDISTVNAFSDDIEIQKYDKIENLKSSKSYPLNVFEFKGLGQLRKYNLAKIRFNPIIYYPATQDIKIFKTIILKIKYEITKNIQNDLLSDNVMDNLASKIIINYQSISSLYNYNKNILNTDTYDYVIITTNLLEKSLNYFKNWKEHIAYNVKIVNTSWIYSNYNGSDEQESIRNFLQDKYISWGIKYLLIIGSNDLIPMRYCLYNDSNNQAILTDYYYADLTSDWDSDNDGIYAEFIEDDAPDFLAEILVGRIPFDSPSIVEDILKKTIDFERDDEEWKKNILQLAGITNYENEVGLGNPKTDGAVLQEKLWNDVFEPNGFSRTTMYEKDGLDPSTYDNDYPLNLENVVNHWNDGFGLVNWVSHGNPQDIYRKIWDHDRNLNNVPDLNEVISQSFLSSNDTIFLNNYKPSIVFSCSCSNSYPEDPDNLGNRLLLNGAVVFIGATQISYYYYGWENENDGGSMAIDYFFFQNLIDLNYSCGEALYNSLFYCWNDDIISSVYENMFVFNLYGDPAISLKVYNKTNPPETPNKPSGPETISSSTEYTYFTSTSHPEDKNVYYLWDWNDGSENELIGPYESDRIVEVKHEWKIPGRYRIRVKALSIYGDESSWSEPLIINVQGPVINIENINGGIKINAEIQNTGDKEAENVNWNMTIYGGSILLGRQTSGTISSIPVSGSSIIVSNLIIGFALPAIVIIEAGIKDSTSDRELQSANIILFNIRIK